MTRPLIDPNLDVQNQAARIALARLEGLSSEERGAVEAWCAANPVHQQELALAEDLFHGPELAQALHDYPVRKGILDQTFAWITALADRSVIGPSMAGGGIVAAIVVGLMLAPSWFAGPQDSGTPEAPETLFYVAERAAPLSVALIDGGAIHLNADSRVEVIYTTQARRVRLVRGEALFEVAPDSDRPFTVEAASAEFTVLGTVFNIDRRGDVVELSVFEGRVAGFDRSYGAGEGALYNARGVQAFEFNTAAGADWRRGWLEARALPLGDAAQELQRYAQRRILIAPGVAARPVTGRFPLNDPETAIRRLAQAQGLNVEESENTLYVHAPQP